MTNIFIAPKDKNATTTEQNGKHKTPGQSWESNSEPLARQSDALPLGYRDN